MVISIFIILGLFSIAFTAIWIWYIRAEKGAHIRLYRAGLKAFNKKDYEEAKNCFLSALAIDQNYKEAIYHLGLTYINLKNYEQAKGYIEKTLKSSPKDFNALFNMGVILQGLDLNEEAKEYYLKALQENPKSAVSYLNLGVISFLQQDYITSLDFLDKANELVPDNIETLFYILRCKDEACGYDAPEEGKEIIDGYLCFQNKTDLPKNFHRTLAKAYAKNGQMEESIKMCEKALQFNTEDIDCYKHLGLAYLIKNDLENAKSSLLTAIDLKPEDEEAHDLLSYVICQQKNVCAVKKCREDYHEAVKKFLNK